MLFWLRPTQSPSTMPRKAWIDAPEAVHRVIARGDWASEAIPLRGRPCLISCPIGRTRNRNPHAMAGLGIDPQQRAPAAWHTDDVQIVFAVYWAF